MMGWGAMRMGRTQRGNLGFAAEVGSLRIAVAVADAVVAVVVDVVAAAAAVAVEHTGSGIRWDIAGKAAGTLAVVHNDQMAGKARRSTVGQVVQSRTT